MFLQRIHQFIFYTHTHTHTHTHAYTHTHTHTHVLTRSIAANPRDFRRERKSDHQLPSVGSQLGQGHAEGCKAVHRGCQGPDQGSRRRFGQFLVMYVVIGVSVSEPHIRKILVCGYMHYHTTNRLAYVSISSTCAHACETNCQQWHSIRFAPSSGILILQNLL